MSNCFYIGLPNRYNRLECSDTPYSVFNSCCGIRTGYRYHRYISENTSLSWNVSWSMPTFQEVDYLYISRADCLLNATDIVLESSPDNVIWNAEQTLTFPFTFTGPREEDIFIRFNPIVSPYYRVRIEYALPTQTMFNKLYLGKLVDLEIMPDVSSEDFRQAQNNRLGRTTSGKRVSYSNRQPVYIHNLEWKGVKNELAAELVDRFPFRGNRYVVLYSEDGRGILNGHQTLHGTIDRLSIEKASKDYSEISFRFTEMKG